MPMKTLESSDVRYYGKDKWNMYEELSKVAVWLWRKIL
jgi:hypothetical protein